MADWAEAGWGAEELGHLGMFPPEFLSVSQHVFKKKEKKEKTTQTLLTEPVGKSVWVIPGKRQRIHRETCGSALKEQQQTSGWGAALGIETIFLWVFYSCNT